MEAQQILEGPAGVRVMLDDTAEPYLYPTEFLIASLNSGIAEVSLRTRCLQDDTGPACMVPLVAGISRYHLLPEVIVVREAHIVGQRYPLKRTTAAMLDKLEPGWCSNAVPRQDRPEYIVFDLAQKSITLFPVPAEAGELRLRIWRLPYESEQIEDLSDEPAIMLPDPMVLKHWVLHECYLVKDSEKYDPERAAMHLQQFEERFGPRPTIQALQQWSVSPLGRRMKVVDF
jgi:hypothetical protein